jgi:hypothetical protein
LVVAVKLAVAPDATVTLDGTRTAELPLDKETFMPPAGDVPSRDTVQVVEVPLVTDAGLHAREDSRAVAAVSEIDAVRETPPAEAVITAVAGAETAVIVAVNVAVVDPDETETLAGTVR